MYWLIVAWTGAPWAGVLAGAVLAFSTAMLTRLAHLQAMHLYTLPLALLSFDSLIRRCRPRDAFCLGLCVAAAALTSGYLVIFVTVALAGAMVARALELRGGVLLRLAATTLATLIVLLLLLSPYLAAQGSRPLSSDAPDIGAALSSYLSTAARLHYEGWSHIVFSPRRDTLFPGVIAILLAGAALVAGRSAPRGCRRMLLAVALVGGVVSLGPLAPVYEWAYYLIPPVQSLRAPSRFGILVIFAVAALAGIGLAAVRARCRGPWKAVAAAGALAVITVECLHAPIPYRPVDYAPPIHRVLRDVGPGAVLELPIHWGRGGSHPNAWYLLASTNHWRPMVAGYGNVFPADYEDIARVLSTFPSAPAVARLQALGVPYVVIHTSRYPRPLEMQRRMAAAGQGVTMVAEAGVDRLYRVHPMVPARGGR